MNDYKIGDVITIDPLASGIEHEEHVTFIILSTWYEYWEVVQAGGTNSGMEFHIVDNWITGRVQDD